MDNLYFNNFIFLNINVFSIVKGRKLYNLSLFEVFNRIIVFNGLNFKYIV